MKILALSALLVTIVNAADYYKECDFNNNGEIDKVFKEKICVKKRGLSELEKSNKEGREEVEKLATILFLLSPEKFKEEKSKLEAKIENESDPEKKKILEEKLAVFEEIENKENE